MNEIIYDFFPLVFKYFECKSSGCKNPDSYVCEQGKWILKTLVNNGVEDCVDGSDEGIAGRAT